MPNLTKDDVRGIIVPIASAFDAAGEIDLKRFEAEVSVMNEAEVDHIIVGGSTGEGAVLSPDELAKLVDVAARNGRGGAIAGILPTSTRDAILRARHACDAGASALLVAPPIYAVPNDEALVRFLDDVSVGSGLPIVFYNHFDAGITSLRRVAKLDGVIAIKDASVVKIAELVQYESEHIAVAVAIDPVPLSGFAIGATASITGVNAVLPAQCVEVYRAFMSGDLAQARRISDTIAPLARLLVVPHNFPAPVKYAINLLGREVGEPRAPYVTDGPAQEEDIRAALVHAGAL